MQLLKALMPLVLTVAILAGLFVVLYVGIRLLVFLRARQLQKENSDLEFSAAWELAREEFRRFTPTKKPASPKGLPPGAKRFTKRSSLMSAAEQEFYMALLNAIPEYSVFPKVRVADVLAPHSRWSGDFLSISQKHFDWIICDAKTSEPLAAVELDDSSHRHPNRTKGDQTKDNAATDAGFSLVRFTWQRNYDPQQVRVTVLRAMKSPM